MKSLIELKKRIINFFLNSERFEKVYNRGIDFYGKQMYCEAAYCFKIASEKKGRQPQVYYNLALTYQYLKEIEKAQVTYKKFLSLKPEDYDGMYNLALIYYTQEHYESAISFFEKCIDMRPDEDGIKALVLSYLACGLEEKALDLAQSLYDGDFPISYYYTAAKVFESKISINKNLKNLETAIEMYFKILIREPANFDVMLSISIAYAKKGEWENSVVYCQKALEANPQSYEANNQMGLVYYCCNNIQDSIRYYETALKLKPTGDFKIYSNLAYAYEKHGEKIKAIKLFKKMISKFPECPACEEIKNHIRILKGANIR